MECHCTTYLAVFGFVVRAKQKASNRCCQIDLCGQALPTDVEQPLVQVAKQNNEQRERVVDRAPRDQLSRSERPCRQRLRGLRDVIRLCSGRCQNILRFAHGSWLCRQACVRRAHALAVTSWVRNRMYVSANGLDIPHSD